ncbi:MAG: tRNA (cytosine(32)/uridine(32)-2'-O)-methyltransferase TrmJ, partial [Gammaproteobacteria bacterium]|nr:tRNA (cytosine(32)/uridine(32)-2'-O)-methyltransferase TrmJ [Gammaproteobacteria bacterium]
PEYSSLNLAAAVQVVCYEIRLALVAEKAGKTKGKKHREDATASSEQLDGMYQHLHDALDGIGFFGTNNPDVVMRRLKALFNRAATTQREVAILRGICSAIQGNKFKK